MACPSPALGQRNKTWRPSLFSTSCAIVLIQFTHKVCTEAYHLEASKFSLYVRNDAGVFHPTNQSHGIFFAQIWNQQIELSLFNGGLCRERICKTSQERLIEP